VKPQLIFLLTLAICCGTLAAQERTGALEFQFGERAIVAPRFGTKVEVVPVLELVGAEVAFSSSAGTWGVVYGEHVLQFATGHKVMLVDGNLHEAGEAPVPSPGGVAASVPYVERFLLGPLGLRLEPIAGGYRIERGARFADPVTIRPAVADFGTTTTLVLALSRAAAVTAVEGPGGTVEVRFTDAAPQLDTTAPFRSRRVRSITRHDAELSIQLAAGVGLLSWRSIDDPPRLTMELGPARPTPTPAPEQSPFLGDSGPRPIVLDPGHGGDDIGARSRDGLAEKELTLALARRVARALEARGYRVRLTRDDDQTRALSDRTALANRLDAQIFVSLHANASTAASVTGAETYYMSLDGPSDAAAAATAELENRADQAAGEPTALDLILWDLAQAEVLNESAALALAVQGRLNALAGTRDRGVRQAPFVVLTGATMPAVLVEFGFLSNPDEARRLAEPEYQRQVAEAIAAGIEDFVGR
jgi:N-acetylmuramoyl-L-alanine amidase